MGGISVWQLLIIAVIVALLFGTKKLRGMGSDLGGAIKGFKKALNEDDSAAKSQHDADFNGSELSKPAQKSTDNDKQG
ncbi:MULTISPECIES: twin-arginine translocase TatA/TatE family subunit [unclassified Vibrio]|uniref:Sec-independent protein translocase protein TatA n=1 Tax=Vibrio sp. HB236076 TaxID=3232307 RepID=A0AB39HCH9_9VIBR|nr:twin-arginine translocase TatA/TatE family subunit [Vibrio sp. HB161653]MDP5255190.1 twin-arginine translocase TatA/TatE family subunit [Vibrio sp. HB161653]